MQSTSTRSRARISSRSCGSKRASCSSAARAAQPRRDEDVAGRLRPAARRRAPDELARRAASSQCSACSALAGEVALAVQRPPSARPRAGGEGDQARVLGRRARRRAAASRGGQLRARDDAARRAVRRRRAELAAVALVARRSARGLRDVEPQRAGRSARSCSVHGSTTAPMRKQATIASTHSGRLPTSVSTTSPRPTPRAAQRARQRAPTRRRPRRSVHSRRAPSRAERDERARAPAAAASTTSRAKFIAQRTLRREGSVPRAERRNLVQPGSRTVASRRTAGISPIAARRWSGPQLSTARARASGRSLRRWRRSRPR